jgi:hypothetical protein
MKTINMNNSSSLESVGNTIFTAWQTGEKTGDYTQMREFVTDAFMTFSHPLMGRHKESSAREIFLKLLDERARSPNNLIFSNICVTAQNKRVIFQFDSLGTVMNGSMPYEGFNLIVFTIEGGILVAFQEYFGYVNPEWFAGK